MGKLTVSYNNNSIIDTTSDGSFTLATSGKLMADDVGVEFEGGVALTLEVNVDTGSAVTVTNGTTTLTGTSANNKCAFTLPEAGTWTASATKDGRKSNAVSRPYESSQKAYLTYDVVAYTEPQLDDGYVDGLDGLALNELNEIAMAISNNPEITSATSEVWINRYRRHICVGDLIDFSIKNDAWDEYNNKIELGTILSTTGQNDSSSTRVRTASYIQIQPQTTYQILTTDQFQWWLHEYDESSTKIKSSTGWTQSGETWTTSANAASIRIVFRKGSDETIEVKKFHSLAVVPVDETTDAKCKYRLMGFNHYTTSSSSAYGSETQTNKAGLLFQSKDEYQNRSPISASTAEGYWGVCNMKNWLDNAFYCLFPSAVSNYIKSVNIVAAGDGGAQTLSSKIFIPAASEIMTVPEKISGSYTPKLAGEGTIYAWYAANASASDRIKYPPDRASACSWWTRTITSTSSGSSSGGWNYYWGAIKYDGTLVAYLGDNKALSYAPCFCI